MDVAKVQKRLAALGFDPGPSDGKAGAKTRAAVKSFQVAHGLAADGIVGPNTMAALFPQERPEGKPMPGFEIANPNGWPKESQAMSFYGGVGLNQTMVDVPYGMRLAWDKSVKVRRFSCHVKVAPSVSRCLANVASRFSERERVDLGVDLFGGCLNVRSKRGGTAYSMHAWGIAIDFDPERNQLRWGKTKARLGKADAIPFWEIWEAEGWVSLGRARDYDHMHVQAARL